MDRLFLDANVLFSAAYRANAGLLQFWKLKNAAVCSSRYALEEARINLARDAQKRRLEKLASPIEFFDSIPRGLPPDVVLPDKDVPTLLAAIAAHSTHLITGDIRATLDGTSGRPSKVCSFVASRLPEEHWPLAAPRGFFRFFLIHRAIHGR